MKTWSIVVPLTAIVWLAPPVRVHAQAVVPDGLAALVAAAETDNPEIRAALRMVDAAEAAVPQAGALPDPQLSVGIMNLPVRDPTLGSDFMTMAAVGLSESFPYPGKLGLREEIASLNAQAAAAEAERTRQRVVADVRIAYYELYVTDRAIEITARNRALLRDFSALTRTRYGVGRGAQSDALRAQVEQTRLSEELLSLEQRRTTLAARLNALLSRDADAALPDPELSPTLIRVATRDGSPEATFASATARTSDSSGVPALQDLQASALVHNPMLKAHVLRIESFRRAVALSEKESLPDFHVSVSYAQRSGFGDMLSANVSVPLPIFSARKQGQRVVQAGAELAEQEARHHTMVDQLKAEIATLAADLDRARGQLRIFDEGILPQSRATLRASTAAFRVDEVDFLSLLDAQVSLYRHELDYHQLLGDFATILAALERAVGTEVVR